MCSYSKFTLPCFRAALQGPQRPSLCVCAGYFRTTGQVGAPSRAPCRGTKRQMVALKKSPGVLFIIFKIQIHEHRRATRRCRPKVKRIGTGGLLHSRNAIPWQMQNRGWGIASLPANDATGHSLAKMEGRMTWLPVNDARREYGLAKLEGCMTSLHATDDARGASFFHPAPPRPAPSRA